MLSSTPAGYVSLGADGRILDWSRAYAATWCGRADVDLAGRVAAEVVLPLLANPDDYLRAVEAEGRDPAAVHTTELRLRNGRTLRRVSLPRGGGTGRFVMYADVGASGRAVRRPLLLTVLPVRAVPLDLHGRAALVHHLASPVMVLSANLEHAERALAKDPPDVAEARGGFRDARWATRRLRVLINGLRRGRPELLPS